MKRLVWILVFLSYACAYGAQEIENPAELVRGVIGFTR
jgi:hypothetical protein